MRRRSKKTMANNPPEVAKNNSPYGGFKFKPGRKPRPRVWPVDPDRDKKIAEFLARKKDNQ